MSPLLGRVPRGGTGPGGHKQNAARMIKVRKACKEEKQQSQMKIEKNPGAVAAILLPQVPAATAGSEPAWQTRDTINGKIYFSLTFWVKTHKLFRRLGSHTHSVWQTGPPAVRLSRVTPMSVTAPRMGCQVPGRQAAMGSR